MRYTIYVTIKGRGVTKYYQRTYVDPKEEHSLSNVKIRTGDVVFITDGFEIPYEPWMNSVNAIKKHIVNDAQNASDTRPAGVPILIYMAELKRL